MTQIDNRDSSQEKIKFFVNNLKSLKDKIESVNIFHQIEILRIFNDNNVCITENKNGIFINITKLNDQTLTQLDEYMKYVIKQEEQVNEIEYQKELITKEYFDCKA